MRDERSVSSIDLEQNLQIDQNLCIHRFIGERLYIATYWQNL
jgi:hypothetical protein